MLNVISQWKIGSLLHSSKYHSSQYTTTLKYKPYVYRMKTIIIKIDKDTGGMEAFSTLTAAVSAYGKVAYQTVANAMSTAGNYINDEISFERLEINRNGNEKRKPVIPFRKK